MSAWSCDQLCPITADHMYTDHQGTDDQCALMISVAPAVPPVSVSVSCVSAHQCLVPVPISATSIPHSACQCTSMPHISAHLSCLSVPPISASQATYQWQSVPPISASQCRL
ncbi:unnamed protein product, partial [Staurois parvus]